MTYTEVRKVTRSAVSGRWVITVTVKHEDGTQATYNYRSTEGSLTADADLAARNATVAVERLRGEKE